MPTVSNKVLKAGLGSRSTWSRMIWLEPFYFFFRSRSTLKNWNGFTFNQSWRKLLRLQQFFDIILQGKKLFFWFCSDRNTLLVHKN